MIVFYVPPLKKCYGYTVLNLYTNRNVNKKNTANTDYKYIKFGGKQHNKNMGH